MTITAKFPGTCGICHGRFEAGEQILWAKGVATTHLACPPSPTLANPAPAPKTVGVTEPGVYENADGIYVVKFNREKTRLYAKRLIEINADRSTEAGECEGHESPDGAHMGETVFCDGTCVAQPRAQIEFEYESGAIYKLDPADKMPLDKAKALTIRYGRCIVCGRHLKAAESVERGIGPVCRKSFA
jgi:hypothetical protein